MLRFASIALLVVAIFSPQGAAASFTRNIPCTYGNGGVTFWNPGPGNFKQGWLTHFQTTFYVVPWVVTPHHGFIKHVAGLHTHGTTQCELSDGGLL